MIQRPFLVRTAAAAVLLGAFSTDAAAVVQRTFVASTGNDLNPCNVATLPCRSFAGAMSVLTAGGEVIVLDSAGYGPVTIIKPVTIIAPPGVYAGVTATAISGNGGNGIVVDPGAGDVTLRGLTVNNLGATGNGIQFSSGNALYLDNVTVTGFNGGFGGLHVVTPTASSVYIVDSTFRGNLEGAHFAPGGTLTISIERVLFEGNNFAGVEIAGGTATIRSSSMTGGATGLLSRFASVVEVRDSTIARNSTSGVSATLSADVSIVSSLVTENGTGVLAAGAATVYVSDSTITRNTTGVNAGSATIVSAGDNRLANNATDGTFSSVVLKQ